ncbi:MAG: superfamily [Anaerosporomusa subterranea]|jgi:HAD superfamily phosphatase (TIGR01668 family)|nr:superfamily [Anaerosporomusa subterranea]
MLQLLCPRLMVNSLLEIDITLLRQQGIDGIVLDLDNTILPWDSAEICPEAAIWLHRALDSGLKAGLVSNNRQRRVAEFAGQFAIPFAARAFKPASRGFQQVIAEMNLTPDQVAVVGDQLFTDILGGNRLGCWTIWVKPLSAREFIGTKVTRQLEKLAVRVLQSKNMI